MDFRFDLKHVDFYGSPVLLAPLGFEITARQGSGTESQEILGIQVSLHDFHIKL